MVRLLAGCVALLLAPISVVSGEDMKPKFGDIGGGLLYGGVILEVRAGGGSLWPLPGDLPGGTLRGVGEARRLAGGMRWGRG